jgi:hypothetical protein
MVRNPRGPRPQKDCGGEVQQQMLMCLIKHHTMKACGEAEVQDLLIAQTPHDCWCFRRGTLSVDGATSLYVLVHGGSKCYH